MLFAIPNYLSVLLVKFLTKFKTLTIHIYCVYLRRICLDGVKDVYKNQEHGNEQSHPSRDNLQQKYQNYLKSNFNINYALDFDSSGGKI